MYLIGYIKLWRKSLVSQVFASETLWHIWCWCLLKTNRFKKETFFRTGKSGITITVQPGQFIFGRHTAADELNKPGSTVWYNIQKLQKLGMIKIETNKQYSIISIVNWKDYQGEVDKQLTSNGQATDKQLTQHKNGKKGKKVKKKKIKEKMKIPPDKKEVAEYIAERGNKVNTDTWYNNYQSKGWMVGKNKMVDWKAAVRTWESNNFGKDNEESEIEWRTK